MLTRLSGYDMNTLQKRAKGVFPSPVDLSLIWWNEWQPRTLYFRGDHCYVYRSFSAFIFYEIRCRPDPVYSCPNSGPIQN